MKGAGHDDARYHRGLHGQKAALQVVCLGGGGGPSEENVTGLLVRSVESEWARGSLLAVDAGSHLAPIIRILERDFPSVSPVAGSVEAHGAYGGAGTAAVGESNGVELNAPSRNTAMPTGTSLPPSPTTLVDEQPSKPEPTVLHSGPFAGLKFPNASARANALHVIRNYVSTYLITHPHLDHLSGFAINTAAFHATSRPKTLAALPSTVEAVKNHIFNDVIWPNLTDEDGGVGFVTFQRLKEGGDVMVGEGEGRGYIDVSDRLGVKAFKVSHGVCTKSPPSHRHRGSIQGLPETQPPYNGSGYGEPAQQTTTRRPSQFSIPPGTPRAGYHSNQPSPRLGATTTTTTTTEISCVVDSTVFFIREEETNREVLIFGDVEPDSISLSPRNHIIWEEAARKIAHGYLGGIFIECSYDDSQADAVLFGHLNPRHLIAELQTLAGMVSEARATRAAESSSASAFAAGGSKKRKRSGANGLDVFARHYVADTAVSPDQGTDRKRSRSLIGRSVSNDSRRGSLPDHRLPSLTAHQTSDPHNHYRSSHLSSPPAALISDDARATTQFPARHNKSGNNNGGGGSSSSSGNSNNSDSISPKADRDLASAQFPPDALATAVGGTLAPAPAVHAHAHNPHSSGAAQPSLPLAGLRVIVIHIKDTLKDGPHVSENILAQLGDYERRLREEGTGLGCEFEVARSGESYWF